MRDNTALKLALACNIADAVRKENKRLRSFGKKIGFPLYIFESVDYSTEMIAYEQAILDAVEKLPKPEWLDRVRGQYKSWE